MAYKTYEREKSPLHGFEYERKIYQEAYENGLEVTSLGTCADYIPELAKSDPDAFGLCVALPDGTFLEYGDCSTRFSVQSISKVINLCAALKFRGFRDVFSHVLMEPSGDSFNSIIKLDTVNKLPYNPMINAGAIQTVSLLVQDGFTFEDLLGFARKMCSDPDISLNEAVFKSEAATGDRNRAIAYLLKSKGVLMAEPLPTLDLYFRLCSLNVNARSLAGLGLTLACNGTDPVTGRHYLHPGYVRTVKSIMFSCGLYDASGQFAVKVGLPAKSGVGGGLVCASEGPRGFGCYGPALDRYGNTVAGVAAMEHISHCLGLHVFDSEWD